MNKKTKGKICIVASAALMCVGGMICGYSWGKAAALKAIKKAL